MEKTVWSIKTKKDDEFVDLGGQIAIFNTRRQARNFKYETEKVVKVKITEVK